MSEEAYKTAWYAWLACQRHMDRLTSPTERYQSAVRLRELLDKHITDTKVFAPDPELAVLLGVDMGQDEQHVEIELNSLIGDVDEIAL